MQIFTSGTAKPMRTKDRAASLNKKVADRVQRAFSLWATKIRFKKIFGKVTFLALLQLYLVSRFNKISAKLSAQKLVLCIQHFNSDATSS